MRYCLDLAKCPVCKIEQVGYNWTVTKTGKKWLANSSGKWHDCPASQSKFSNSKYEKRTPLIDKDFEFCNMCDTFLLTKESHIKYPNISYISMDDHILKYHQNSELLDDIDFKPVSDSEKEKFRILWNKPKRTNEYILIGKKLI